MERLWEITRNVGGGLLVAEIIIFLMGSAHSGHLLRNSREFGHAFDEVTQGIMHEFGGATNWMKGK